MKDIATLLITTFQADVTPPLGSPLCGGLVPPAKKIVDPLSARGIILFTDDLPIVLCAIDWAGIYNESHDLWRDAIAAAAGTSRDRVSVHTLHQHDAPMTDRSLANFLEKQKVVLEGTQGSSVKFEKDAISLNFEKEAIERVAQAICLSLNTLQPVSHVSMGKAKVNEFASNRRILGKNGKIECTRFSSCKMEQVRRMDEGLVDPFVRSIGLWNKDKPLVSLSYYASHPQSFYGRGAVSYDTVGLARALREATLPDAAHIHFNGAGGNITAGKYNDGTPINRFKLAGHLAVGMEKAWDNSVKLPITAANLKWKIKSVSLPLASYYDDMESIKALMNNETAPIVDRVCAAQQLVYEELIQSGRTIDISCLKLGPASLLHLPGELFVEYQLAAQAMRPSEMVCLAAYGDCGPVYIGTKASYEQGGYGWLPNWTRVGAQVERTLLDAMCELLK